MSVLIAILLAIFVLPSPWGVVAIGVAAAWEIFQTFGAIWWSQRRRAVVGAEALVGVDARVVTRCDPLGRASIRGEIWNARSRDVAEVGETVRVYGVDGLTLLVERKDAAVSEPQSHHRQ